MISLTQKFSALSSLHKVSLVVLASVVSFAAVSLASANVSSKHDNVLAPAPATHTKSKVVTTTATDTGLAAASALEPNSAGTATPKNSSAGNVSTTPAAPTKSTAASTAVATATTAPVTTTTATPTPVSSVAGVYDGYGYHVEGTQIVDTISRSSAQACGGYLCGTNGPTISYNATSPAAGSFQFVEGNDIASNVKCNIKSGGLSKGNSPAFSPVSISPNLPNGTYKGTIQLQFDTDTNDDYANGPAISYTVILTD